MNLSDPHPANLCGLLAPHKQHATTPDYPSNLDYIVYIFNYIICIPKRFNFTGFFTQILYILQHVNQKSMNLHFTACLVSLHQSQVPSYFVGPLISDRFAIPQLQKETKIFSAPEPTYRN